MKKNKPNLERKLRFPILVLCNMIVSLCYEKGGCDKRGMYTWDKWKMHTKF
jgi:hypothetical protein